MIAIIAAMAEEVAKIKSSITDLEIIQKAHVTFYIGNLAEKNVVLTQSGIGKVNASVATTLLFESFPIEYCINIGTAGGIKNDANVLDIVVSTEVAHHDVDVTGFNYVYGQVPGSPATFKSEPLLVQKIKTILEAQQFPHHLGLIVSGDAFIHRPDQLTNIKSHFPEAIAVEMEAAAIAQVCSLYHKPFLILRSLSDIAGKASNISFDQYVQVAANNAAKFIEELIQD